MKEWIPIAISAVTLIFVIVAFVRSGGWHAIKQTEDVQGMIKELEGTIRNIVADHQESDTAEFASVREQINASRREAGEVGAALREKVKEVELYIRDNYLHKRSFETILETVTRDIRGLGEKIEGQTVSLSRLEGKFGTDPNRN